MENKGMSPDEFLSLSEKIKSVPEDTTPFAVVKDDKISVVGDANKTEIKKNDYEIKFRMPKAMLGENAPADAQVVGDFIIFTVNYKDVTITPRNDLKIIDSIFKVQPFFNKLKDNGDIEEMNKEELLSVFAYAGEEIHLAIYNLVATFLGIDDKMGEYMLPFSVVSALNRIIDTHPEIFNEADVFFG